MLSLPRLLALVPAQCLLAAHSVAQISLDGSLGPRQSLSGPHYTIDSAAGQIRGANLFHSFGVFNIRAGESATFTHSQTQAVSNVLSRVTGGERSFIDGTLRSTIPGANVFLFNPSGVAFGPNAVLDVPAAFHVSTADYLRFADGAFFHANLEKGSTLTSAPPAAFGFLSQAPAAASFDRSAILVSPASGLSVVAGDVSLAGGALRAPSGRVQIAAVASPGEVVVGATELDVAAFARLGTTVISSLANVSTSSPAGAGSVLIRSGRLVVDNAEINANTTGSGDGAARGIDIHARDEAVFTNGARAQAFTDSPGRSGDIRIAAEKIEVRNGAVVSSLALGAGRAGNVAIDGGEVHVLDGGFILARTFGASDAGNIDITASDVRVASNSVFTAIFASTGGTGRSGNVSLNARNVTVSRGEISNVTFGSGNAGKIALNVRDRLVIDNVGNPNGFAGIFANTFWTGKGGEIEVTAGGISLSNQSGIQAATMAQGDAGGIVVRTGRLAVTSGSHISTHALNGSGNAGNLFIQADDVLIRGIRDSSAPFTSPRHFTGFSSTTGVAGKKGGEVRVDANSIFLTDKATITSASSGAGDAGRILITTKDLRISGRAQINSNAFGSGRGGDIDIRGGVVIVENAGAPLGPNDPPASSISTQAGLRGGAAGNLNIVADRMEILDGGRLTTETFGAGDGGDVNIRAGTVIVSGINPAFEDHLRSIPGGLRDAARSSIIASTSGSFLGEAATGNAGNVRVTAGEVLLSAGGALLSTTNAPGAGGSIEVHADRVALSADALVSTSSRFSPQAGRAGNIAIQAAETLQVDASTVTSSSEQAAGGSIRLFGRRVALENATVGARTTGLGDAGEIFIVADDALTALRSTVSTDAFQADGGNVTLMARSMMRLVDTTVSTSVGTGGGKGGNITIDPQFVLLNRSELRADALGGPGGNIRIAADVFLAGDSVLSASSALSTPGSIAIDARFTDVSGNVTRLPESAPVAAAMLRTPCAARLAAGKLNSLVVAGREGTPPGPEDLLPSPLIAEAPAPHPIKPLSAISILALGSSCAPLPAR